MFGVQNYFCLILTVPGQYVEKEETQQAFSATVGS